MTTLIETASAAGTLAADDDLRQTGSPRGDMAARLPHCLQPFLTWMTAQPLSDETIVERSPRFYMAEALGRTMLGIVVTGVPLLASVKGAAFLMLIGLTFTSSGLGFFQVVIFHHCAHGTVFRKRERNRQVGRLISALLLFKYFDDYQREHMAHHSPRKLLTEEDEFANFIFGMCRLAPGTEKSVLWRHVLIGIFSPAFHLKFLQRRVKSSLLSVNRIHNLIGIGAWLSGIGIAIATGQVVLFLVAWVLPVTVLLQIATVFRILCEHRFPDHDLIAVRDKTFMCHATAGVFAGSAVPQRSAATPAGLIDWIGWWAEMLTLHLFTRLFVLVGDAPCHDYHHRHPASRKWTNYIHARQHDRERGCPGFPVDYQESWGLFVAIDENLDSLAATPPNFMGATDLPLEHGLPAA